MGLWVCESVCMQWVFGSAVGFRSEVGRCICGSVGSVGVQWFGTFMGLWVWVCLSVCQSDRLKV